MHVGKRNIEYIYVDKIFFTSIDSRISQTLKDGSSPSKLNKLIVTCSSPDVAVFSLQGT
jgi:hypothetical protein